ncbi:MAG TPA: cbb3-type cytochrome c oxidase subunit I [Chitinophagaceae bacterium]|nr:cbb3-type cytochrome c oxidase subunit I [Chitinophagaceae bacterium]
MRYFKALLYPLVPAAAVILLSLMPSIAYSQTAEQQSVFSHAGIIGAIVVAVLLLILLVLLVTAKVSKLIATAREQRMEKARKALREELLNNSDPHLNELLAKRKSALRYTLRGDELSGRAVPEDERGVIKSASSEMEVPFISEKKYLQAPLQIDPGLKKLILAFIGMAAFWLIFGTSVGEYLGIKFVSPDVDHLSWLSFGRLRPVHTNTVFWGWASLAMIGLAYFVIPRTSNTKIYSLKIGWWSLSLLNAAVVIGDFCLMAGINNGGGEYREYIWPVMGLFAAGLLLTLYNFYKTVAGRKAQEIYISNWYILAALIWTLTMVTIGYLPWYQQGLGETVIQGYYMHNAVGMWFMTFTLGLMYYYLPAALNKPIYSYSLGVLAFWTQMLFYTMIGSHHFIFSPLPWWLQTIAIVFSVGMFIPVISGTTNFLLTMKGSWKAISDSYVLPFLLVGVVYYFLGSSQGSFEAFRFTNYAWHFTDYTVAHSHMTMYGIITFMVWGCLYYLLPRITGREPRQAYVGMHFWFAFIGLLMYEFSLMIGGTMRGVMWMQGVPFIQSVVKMAPYWLWRAIGGSLMLFSHFVFAYNIYFMFKEKKTERKDLQTSKALSLA